MSNPPPEQLRGSPRPIFIKLQDIAVKIGVTSSTLVNWSNQGHFSLYRLGRHTKVVEEREVMDWVLSQRLKPRHGAVDQPRLRSLKSS